MKIHFTHKALAAVSLFSAVADIRYYLNSVQIRATKGETRLTATDGHTLAVHRHLPAEGNDVVGEVELIVPSDAVAKMVKWKGQRSITMDIDLTLPDNFATAAFPELRADWFGEAVLFKAVDGKFPDISRVIPDTLTGEAAGFQPEFLTRCRKAHALMTGSKTMCPPMAYNGQGSALFQISEDMVAVVMPMRDMLMTKENIKQCQWAKGGLFTSKPKAEKKAA